MVLISLTLVNPLQRSKTENFVECKFRPTLSKMGSTFVQTSKTILLLTFKSNFPSLRQFITKIILKVKRSKDPGYFEGGLKCWTQKQKHDYIKQKVVFNLSNLSIQLKQLVFYTQMDDHWILPDISVYGIVGGGGLGLKGCSAIVRGLVNHWIKNKVF